MPDGLTSGSTDATSVGPLTAVSGLSLPSVGANSGAGSRAVKRAIDLTIALTALILLAPLMVLLAALIRAESEGPALFRQVRLGRDRRPFQILKLRTMQDTAQAAIELGIGERNPLSHRADPALITQIGGFLRRTGLDELPQLFNVLRGDMSLVGPRPFVPEECAGLPPWSEPRFTVRPGLTGVWQVRGQHALSIEELCSLDLQYASGWSVGHDLHILALTPARLFRGSS